MPDLSVSQSEAPEIRYAWLIWGRRDGQTLPLGCYATREVALAAEDLAKAQPGAGDWEDIWITPWPLQTEPRVNFRMKRRTPPEPPVGAEPEHTPRGQSDG